MGFFLVMKAEVVRTWIIMRRYWFRTVTGMIIGYAMLIMLIMGFMYKGQGATVADKFSDPERAVNWALSFIIGMFAFGIVGMFTQGLQELAQSGQLEQLCMSPHGLVTNFLARSAVSSVTSITSSAVMLWLIAWTVKFQLPWELVPGLVVMALAYTNLIGFGFMVGGLVLVFKQTGQIAVLIRLTLFGVAILATEEIEKWAAIWRWIAHAIPVTDAAICLKYVIVRGQMQPTLDAAGNPVLSAAGDPVLHYLSIFAHPSFYFLIANCTFWTLTGILCFRIMENYSRDKGTLGAY